MYVDHDITYLIVKVTNPNALQILNKIAVITRSSRNKQWVPTRNLEIKKFLELLLWMDWVRVGSLLDYNFNIPGKIILNPEYSFSVATQKKFSWTNEYFYKNFQ